MAGRPDTRADLSISKRFHFLGGDTGEMSIFQVRHGENLKRLIIVDGGI